MHIASIIAQNNGDKILKIYDFTKKTKDEIQDDMNLLTNTFNIFLNSMTCDVLDVENNLCFNDYLLNFKIPSDGLDIKIRLTDFFSFIKEDENQIYFDLSLLEDESKYIKKSIYTEKYLNFIKDIFELLNKLKVTSNVVIGTPKFLIKKNKNIDSCIFKNISIKPYESHLIPIELREIHNGLRIGRIKVELKMRLSELHKMEEKDSALDFIAKIFENDFLYSSISKEIPFSDGNLKEQLNALIHYRELVDY